MQFKKGQWVKHPNKPEWGIGEVVDVSIDEKVRIMFPNIGFKTISTNIVGLLVIDDHPKRLSWKVDPEPVRPLCDRFYNALTLNRPNTDDGKLAKNVMRDLERYGDLLPTTRTQLLHWCYTDGNVYQKGVTLAREICMAIYGTIPPKDW